MKKKQKKTKVKDDFLTQEAMEEQEAAAAYTLDIPDDEIWTYQIEGLQAPHINQPFKNAAMKKIIVIIVLLVAIGMAMYFSVRAVHSDTYEYKDLGDGTYELVKFSNPGDITDIVVEQAKKTLQSRFPLLMNMRLTAMKKSIPFQLEKMLRKLTANPFTAAGGFRMYGLMMKIHTIAILTVSFTTRI